MDNATMCSGAIFALPYKAPTLALDRDGLRSSSGRKGRQADRLANAD